VTQQRPGGAPDSLLEVSDLVAGYGGSPILHGVSLRVLADELVAIVGPNGAGKSTLVKVVVGLLSPQRGDVQFAGRSLVGVPPERLAGMGLAYLPQLDNVFRSMTVRENLELGGHRLGKDRGERIERTFQLFPDLRRLLDNRAGTLSGGQRQMLAMARALMLDPRLVILDEPTAGLSPQLSEALFERVLALNAQGVAVLVIEQNVDLALSAADRAYVLAAGENRYEGSGPQVLADPEIGALYLGG
jgi:ABC-type branched-subunit amino acid transport system ATPase component